MFDSDFRIKAEEEEQQHKANFKVASEKTKKKKRVWVLGPYREP